MNSKKIWDALATVSKQTEVDNTNTAATPLTHEIHENISNQSLDLATRIYEDWYDREQEEKEVRKKQLDWIKRVLAWQLVITGAVFVLDIFYEVNTAILIGLIVSIIVEFIGLLSIMVTYFYSERSTKSLDVVARIMGDVGVNNSKYSGKMNNKLD